MHFDAVELFVEVALRHRVEEDLVHQVGEIARGLHVLLARRVVRRDRLDVVDDAHLCGRIGFFDRVEHARMR